MPKIDPSLAPVPPSPMMIRLSPLAGLAMFGFMLLGLTTCLWAMLTGKVDLWPEHLGWEGVRDGEITHHIARELSHVSVAKHAADLERGFSWLTLGDTGPRVRSGCPGWLFLADETRIHPHAEANAEARARKVVAVRDWLAAWNIRLVVLLVPDKSRIAVAKLCGMTRAPALAERLAHWKARLQQAGIATADPTAAMQAIGSASFLRTDTHWSERGAEAAAKAAAEQVRATGVTPSPAQHLVRSVPPEARRAGDLVRLAGLDWLPERLQPPGERVAPSHFEVTQDAAAGSEDDLFGDSQLPNVALIGTSFSRNSNFAPFLEQALRAAVGNFAKDGGEFSGAAREYFASEAFKQTPAQVVVWEINERDLQKPFTDDLPLP
ncbi:cell division protein FtsQ [Pseudomonas entomophila]|uniref:alginate O-acetyltransferase AlgX-related protein n=1 Tax=Pseudomonas entomophila TaxID=312306 RepID=UPI0023D83CBD|nr:cell division protein FtsQ [Pseudomonas entomophila]MDF0734242.1 cell division protein FtsQ [Pseudomonas entomophila]